MHRLPPPAHRFLDLRVGTEEEAFRSVVLGPSLSVFFFAEIAEEWHGRRRNPIFSLSSWVSALRINMLDSQMYTFIIMYSYFLFLAFFTWT